MIGQQNVTKDWENKSEGNKYQSPEPLDNVTESDDEQPVPLPEMVPLSSAITSKDTLMTPRNTPFNIDDSYCNNIYNGVQQVNTSQNDQKLHQQLQYEQQQQQQQKSQNINNNCSVNNLITRQSSGSGSAINTARSTNVVPPLATRGYMKVGMPEKHKKETIKTKKKINDLVNAMRNGDGNHRDAAVRSLTSLMSGGDKQARLHAVKSDCFKLMVEHIQAKCYK